MFAEYEPEDKVSTRVCVSSLILIFLVHGQIDLNKFEHCVGFRKFIRLRYIISGEWRISHTRYTRS